VYVFEVLSVDLDYGEAIGPYGSSSLVFSTISRHGDQQYSKGTPRVRGVEKISCSVDRLLIQIS
jgi:hypothetical protein